MMTQYEAQQLTRSMHKELNGGTHALWQAVTIVLTFVVLGVAGIAFEPTPGTQSAAARTQAQPQASVSADSESASHGAALPAAQAQPLSLAGADIAKGDGN